ncbi:MAG: hypothetical protein LBP43_06115 [Treponema sp.]|jgi:hypothetical protein|nr:hypothetical protein [Treponema sp.]
MIGTRSENRLDSAELEMLRLKINSDAYIHEAIQRIALILSNELFEIPRGGNYHEREERN